MVTPPGRVAKASRRCFAARRARDANLGFDVDRAVEASTGALQRAIFTGLASAMLIAVALAAKGTSVAARAAAGKASLAIRTGTNMFAFYERAGNVAGLRFDKVTDIT